MRGVLRQGMVPKGFQAAIPRIPFAAIKPAVGLLVLEGDVRLSLNGRCRLVSVPTLLQGIPLCHMKQAGQIPPFLNAAEVGTMISGGGQVDIF